MYYLKQSGANKSNDYAKQIYIQNKQWHPPLAPLEIEEKMTEFDKILKKKLQELINKLNGTNLTNLTPQQRAALKHLRTNHEIIIKPTDKNLGPAIMDTKTYIHQVLKEHLLTDTYKQLSSKEAKEKIYGLPKVHKTPMTLRPVVSSVNSFLSVFSTWLDYRMKQLLPFMKSHIKNSFDVINDLKNLTLPRNALLFSADA